MIESLERKKQRIKKILFLLKKNYPTAHCALNFTNPLELLVATQLSAQCTDKRVNQVTQKLFKKYKTAKDYAQSKLPELEQDIKSTGFFRNKARHLKETGLKLEKEHKGIVPKNFKQLTELPGVGNKTAHVVMGNAFHIPSGVVVDTHVKRLSQRMALVETKSVQQIEKKLETLIPKKYWIIFSHWFIEHGRKICTARKTHCSICFLHKNCPYPKSLNRN
ncbi:MAG: endonuclease III [Bdellovibrionales bacterium]|nr:endonuclease III [Bdellovibrionales bacterium]